MAKDSYKAYVKEKGESDGLHVDRATFHAREKATIPAKRSTSDGYMLRGSKESKQVGLMKSAAKFTGNQKAQSALKTKYQSNDKK